MKTENLSTLKIYKLTQEQYDRKLANGEIDQTALYFTDDDDVDVDLSGYATIEQLEGKADAEHTHNDIYYTETEIDEKVDTIRDSISASTNEAKQYADARDTTTLETSKTYTDDAVAQKTQVQIITWGADD